MKAWQPNSLRSSTVASHQALGQRVPHRGDEVQGFVGQGAGGHGW
jgi:hypothetical protein